MPNAFHRDDRTPVSGAPLTTSGIRHLEREVFHFELMLKGIYLVLSPAES
jgi:hypothetical protein